MSDIKNFTLSKLVHISSSNKDNSSISNSNFTVYLGQHNSLYNARRVVLISAIFPNVFYNIRTGIDDTLFFQEFGQPILNIVIPQGFWSVTQLMTNIQTQMNGLLVGSVVTVSQQIPGNYKIIFSYIGNTVNLLFNNSTLAPQIGLTQNTGLVLLAQMTNLPQLQGLTEVFIKSDNLSISNMIQRNDIGVRSIISNIPINSPFLGINIYQSFDDELNSLNYENARSINTIDIQVVDRQNNFVDLQDHSIKLLFKIYY